jgi:hypothetical protein
VREKLGRRRSKMPNLLDRVREWRVNRKWRRDLDVMGLKVSVEYSRLMLLDAQRKQKMLKLYEKIHKRKNQNRYVV